MSTVKKGKKEKESEIEKLREELNTAHEDAKEYTNKYLRALADLDNQRKRTIKEKEEIQKYASERLILSILPVVDNFERAIDASKNTEDVEKILDGIKLILRQLKDILEKEGLKSFECVGEKFDPYMHEAFLAIESKEHEPSTVLEEIEKGYVLRDKVIRPAKVTVSKQDKKKEDDENGI
ncbi:nucleotide exchange factor GrpE [candidate division WOR-3 bacterium]|nr:nucleotide exchange factor GrpE [candidate division WOR-3 bacterium]